MVVKIKTGSYPNNARSEWVIKFLVPPFFHNRDKNFHFTYEVYPNQLSMDKGDLPFLINSHRAQIRENHQRIVRRPSGALVHISGAEVMPEDVADFLANENEVYRWGRKSDVEWEDDRGRKLVPWMFPTYQGIMEGLDPQWQREMFVLPQVQQVSEVIDLYLKGAEARRLTGDHRGTTLDLQVGASSDDANQLISDVVQLTEPNVNIDSVNEHVGTRFIGTIPSGVTVDVTRYGIFIFQTTQDEPQHQLRGETGAAPSTFTTTSNDIDGRARTSATHNWDSANLGAGDLEFWEWGASSPGAGNGTNVKSIIQENVDAVGELTTLVFIWEQHTDDGARDLGLRLYDGDTSEAAKVHIEYTAQGERKQIPPIHWNSNIAAFSRHHAFMIPGQPFLNMYIASPVVEGAPGVGQPFYILDGRYLPDFISIRQI